LLDTALVWLLVELPLEPLLEPLLPHAATVSDSTAAAAAAMVTRWRPRLVRPAGFWFMVVLLNMCRFFALSVSK
jgi:hypothetical protein